MYTNCFCLCFPNQQFKKKTGQTNGQPAIHDIIDLALWYHNCRTTSFLAAAPRKRLMANKTQPDAQPDKVQVISSNTSGKLGTTAIDTRLTVEQSVLTPQPK